MIKVKDVEGTIWLLQPINFTSAFKRTDGTCMVKFSEGSEMIHIHVNKDAFKTLEKDLNELS